MIFKITKKGPIIPPIYINNAKEFYKAFGRPYDILKERRNKINKIICSGLKEKRK